ncbi:MAG: ParA family protein [Acidobacteriota bacterium]|nr:ParA family protein [Acidobacteriota bacterium]
MAECLAVVNQKGGVGKTTSAVNLAACAALDGKRVLLVDTDPQGNATTGLGIDRSELESCVYDLLTDDTLREDPESALDQVLQATKVPGLDLIPATIDLAGADLTLASAIARETRLRHALQPAHDRYDVIFVDTAPSLGLLTVNSLAAAKDALIPIQAEYYALEGLAQLIKVVKLVQAQINPELSIRGVVITMFDGRANLSAEVAEEVRHFLGPKVYERSIPRNIKLAEAPSHGLPAVVYEPSCRGAKAYWDLYREVFPRA